MSVCLGQAARSVLCQSESFTIVGAQVEPHSHNLIPTPYQLSYAKPTHNISLTF